MLFVGEPVPVVTFDTVYPTRLFPALDEVVSYVIYWATGSCTHQ